MIRYHILMRVVAVFLVAGCDSTKKPDAPPVPIAALALPGNEYMPTQLGTKWLFQSPEGRKSTHEIVASVEVANSMHITVLTADEDQDKYEIKYVVNKTGLYIAKNHDVEYDPAYQVLVLPHVKGEEWKRPKQKSDGAKQNFTALAAEVIKIGSISVEAIGVEHLTTISPLAMYGRRWYAPKIGLVKLESWVSDDTFRVIWELQSYELGK